ncbi:hypothetical protein HYH03_005502 [Edaphochlamys debaryana]|uniref:mRNA-decapping enzyme-like protein n=1 Tax=Edaphochlamys debaryana TaxID=47281 RepID=A0A836C270_9CHLO|nr:hypothetical protein HYH03_005502 [Edaphochlamys debaryana]|eukprot:KAG2496269.1 hypothetical protein HYH03_005502 [Edaphochlamys debaryana]
MAPPVAVASDTVAMLKRFDEDVEEVLASSGHVSMYTMAVETQSWSRKEVEGSLFILKRRGTPRFQLLVLNKLSTANYVEDVHSGLDFELNPPYLMYTHGNSEIIGVWFYEPDDLARVEEVLKRIKHQAGPAIAPAPTAQSAVKPARAAGGDDAFWDKPHHAATAAEKAAAAQRLGVQAPAPAAAAAPAAASPADGANNLANLLRNATIKQQQGPAASPATPPPAGGPLPPSFFAQARAPAVAPAPQAPPPQQQAPFPGAPPVHAPQPAPMPPHIAPSPQAPVATPPGPGGNALAKLFANANKGPAPPPPPHAAQAIPVPVPASPGAAGPAPHAPPPQPPPHAAAMAPPQAPGAVPDEERVRRLLGRIATNEGLLRMLAAEMRAVGMLQ